MKKFVSGLAILLALSLVTCEMQLIGGPDEELGYTNVVYSPDGRSVTFYLDGTTVPETRASRTLTDDLAKIGHDYFEVVFFRRPAYTSTETLDTTNDTIARTSWEIGQSANITGVYRTNDGNDYSTVKEIYTLVDSTLGDPELCTAILFVGRKSDKTLLAVGKISHIDDVPVTSGNPKITTTTKTVTFSVTAFTANAAYNSTADGTTTHYADGSSFWTAVKDTTNKGLAANVSSANTAVRLMPIGGQSFPLFELLPDDTIAAKYTIGVKDTAGITGYIDGIRVYDDTGSVTKREPRYPVGGGFYNYASFTLDQITKVTLENNNVANSKFAADTQFKFETFRGTTPDKLITTKSIFALTFEIPVYALTRATGVNAPAAEKWYIRPGFGTYRYDLDDGKQGPGGAVLLGTSLNDQDPIGIIVKN